MLFKKMLSAILSFSFIAASVPLNRFPSFASEAISGDVNSDGEVNIADAVTLQNWILGNETDITEGNIADLSYDGQVDSLDLTILKKIILNSDGKLFPHIVINEVCTSNSSCYKDKKGNFPDWIELYNTSDFEIDLSGIGVSDGKKNRYKYTFPDGSYISAHSFIMLLCDGTDTVYKNEIHIPIKLSATGETVYLTAPQNPDGSAGKELSSVSVPAIDSDTSYGRLHDGNENFMNLTCSPMESNNNSDKIYNIKKPVFSALGGFYDEGFNVSISDLSGNTVMYTLDGSDPRTSNTAMVYKEPIKLYDNTNEENILSSREDITLAEYHAPDYKVDKGIIIRAASEDSEGHFSKVVTNGYYIGKKSKMYSDFKVISLTTDPENFFNKDNGIYVVGSEMEEWLETHELTVDPNNKSNNTNFNSEGSQWERPCNMQIFENGILAYNEDVGVRISGNWSRGFAQKSLKLYGRNQYGSSKMKYDFFPELYDSRGKKINEFKKIVLHNGGSDCGNLHFRDELIHDLVLDIDSIAPQASEPAIVFLDGEFWGFYFIREKVDENFLESHYNIKADDITFFKDNQTTGDIKLVKEFSSLTRWALNQDMSIGENVTKISESMDLDNLIDYFAVQTYINNTDWSMPGAFYNWMMWRSNEINEANPYEDGKWRLILYDTDQSAGMNNGKNDWYYSYDRLGNLFNMKTSLNFCGLLYKLLENDSFRSKFESRYKEIAESFLSEENALRKIEEYDSAYNEAIAETAKRFTGDAGNYQYALAEIKIFFQQRYSFAIKYLEKLISNYKEK